MEQRNRKKIEYAFYNFEKMRDDALEYLQDVRLSGLTVQYGKVGCGSGVSNPTEEKAIKCAEYEKMLWTEVVERTCIYFNWSIEKSIIEMKYFKGKKSGEIMRRLHIERTPYFYHLRRILHIAYQFALELGLFDNTCV